MKIRKKLFNNSNNNNNNIKLFFFKLFSCSLTDIYFFFILTTESKELVRKFDFRYSTNLHVSENLEHDLISLKNVCLSVYYTIFWALCLKN